MTLLPSHRSIRHRLRLLVLVTVLITLGVSYAALLGYETKQIQKSILSEVQTLGAIIAGRAGYALAFRDQEAAHDHLASLGVHPAIEAAAISEANGALFAAFHTGKGPAALAAPASWPRTYAFRDRKLETVTPIMVDGKCLGWVYLRADTEKLRARIISFSLILGAVLALSAGLATLVASRFQKPIIEPLEAMAATARMISQGRYDLRVDPSRGDAEIRTLGQSFNDMVAQIEQHAEHLEEVVELRTRELAVATRAAEDASLAKSEFLANMSHEIRTPMNAVVGMTHLALQTAVTAQQRGYLEKTQIAARGLLGIINDILDFSKIEAGKLRMEAEEFLLEDVFDRVTSLVGQRATEKRLEFMLDTATDVPASLVGDPLRLGQVLVNLCSNAVKFTETGEFIIVTFQRLRTEADRVTLQFSVRDTGIGMTPEQISQLFQPFSQVDLSSTRRFGGTGLGLAISKRLVQLMGGQLWVVSEPGQGSEFFFTASFGLGHLQPKASGPQPRELSHLRVLIVDDSANSREILGGLVRGLGYEAVPAASAEAGLALLRQAPFDLVLMDWRMPNMDGLEASRLIRQDPSLKSKPRIILVTGYGEDEVARSAQQGGLDGYLTKPVTPSTLFDTVLKTFGKSAGIRSETSPEPAPELLTRLQGAQVLLVEDNDFNQEVAVELLGLYGVQVTVAGNGQAALREIQARRFDAVLMDLQMPVMDGYEATRQMRADPALNDLPILAMTAHAMLQERERCLALGMNDYLTKPIDPATLASTLAKWVRSPG